MMKKKKVIIFSKDESVEKSALDPLRNKAEELGAWVEQEDWSDDITHVVYYTRDDQESLTERVMCGLASGKWTVSASFILKSHRLKTWENEKNHLIYGKQCLEFRRSLEQKGEDGKAFFNMKAVLFTNYGFKKSAYSQVIKAGGGKVISNILTFRDLNMKRWEKGELNHVFIDPFYIVQKSEQRQFLAKFVERCQKDVGTVHFLKFEFIRDFLYKGGVCDTDRYKISLDDYKVRSETNGNNSKKRKEPEEITLDEKSSDESIVEISDDENQHNTNEIEVLVDESRRKRSKVYRDVQEQNPGPKDTDQILNYADMCRKQKESITASHKGSHSSRVKRKAAAKSRSVDSESGDKTEDESSRSGAFLKVVDFNRLITDHQSESTPPVGLGDGLIIPTVMDTNIDNVVNNSDINPMEAAESNVNAVNDASISLDHQSLESCEEYVENSEADLDLHEKESKHIKALMNIPIEKRYPEYNQPDQPVEEDVKPELKPVVAMPLLMDTSKLETYLAALNSRFSETYENLGLSNTGAKVLNYSSKETFVRDKSAFRVSQYYSKGPDEIKKLRSFLERLKLLNDVEISWNVNQTWDKAVFNFVLKYCLFLEKCPQIRVRAYKLLTDYTFIHLNKRTKDREKFVATLLGSLNFDKNEKDTHLSNDSYVKFWNLLVKRVCNQAKNLDTRSGSYMCLQYLVNTMVRDFTIFWKGSREPRGTFPIIYYFIKDSLGEGLSSEIKELYSNFLQYDVDTQLPRKLLTMIFHVASYLDAAKAPALHQGNKVKVIKKICKVLSQSDLDDEKLYIEVSLLEPNILSCGVSSLMLGAMYNISIIRLIDFTQSGSQLAPSESGFKRNLLVENSVHKLIGALQLHTIARMDQDENQSMFPLVRYLDKTKQSQQLYLQEVSVPLLSEEATLCIKSEINTFLQFFKGSKKCVSEAGAVASLLFEVPDQTKAAAVASQSEAAAVAGQSETATVASQSETAAMAGQSETAAMAGQSETAAVAGQSETASVAGQSETAAVAGQSETAAVAGQSEALQMIK